MNKEFFAALELLEKEKGIPKEYMLEKIEAALVSAYKKEYGNNTNVRVLIDPAKEDVRIYQQKTVVEVVENPIAEISLEDARAIRKRYNVGDVVETEDVNGPALAEENGTAETDGESAEPAEEAENGAEEK